MARVDFRAIVDFLVIRVPLGFPATLALAVFRALVGFLATLALAGDQEHQVLVE